jgi:hypothetical protein
LNVFSTAQQSDGSQVAVLAVRSLTIQQSAHLTVQGTVPLVVFAQSTVNIQGIVETAAPGNAGGPSVTQGGTGGGPGGGSGANGAGGAGGGGYCGVGGHGAVAADAGAPISGGRAYGTATITPLIGGSAGGNVASWADGGEGGGAIQISAGTSIIVGTAGVINVPGYGGGSFYGGGGGSGGALLLEAPTVTINGVLAANGGGAGVSPNSNEVGQAGQPNGQPAMGGDMLQGTGAAGNQVNGGDGLSTNVEGGSGGGAAGRIRINTRSGLATIGASAIVSPALTTSCATQGMIGG